MNTKPLQYWLFFCAFMVFAMAIIGAITRLTESGLSMVEWRPLVGTIPPLTAAEWERVFGLYQQTAEYRQKNFWMGIEDFKYIFFWEWFHRVWGRLIGLVYALPLAYFWIKGMIPQGYKLKFLIALALGGAQGVMGWYMVMSGLADKPDVSHFRLAAHLSLAFFIFGYLIWMGLSLSSHPNPPPLERGEGRRLKAFGWGVMALLSLTIIWGAFVAGLDGGLLYNTWPHMGAGQIVPQEVTGFAALLHDPAGVQFFHRWIAIVAAFVLLSFAWRIKSFPLAGMTFVQVGLGLATLLTQVWIPLAAAHQAGALILILIMVYHLQRLHAVEKETGVIPESP